ncbi:outer membrane protein [Methylocapsa sp. S129]|uniref:outer membrane protein n=1 Tax=Methylocapsa sp. S129 TaxID=1641869 RepID=UPI00131D22D6|nr:outer membrane beta-barrel protein [Methylocapsa sp. S129]
MRVSALFLLTIGVFGMGFARPALADGPDYRTNTGPNGADFSGVNLGVDAGVALGSASGANTSGPAGGLHLGYNFQAAHLVGGAEIDSMFGSIKAGSLGGDSFNQNFLSSARVKAGYAFGDILGYGTIGWAYSTATYEDPLASESKTLKGSVFGFGAEYALTRTVSIRAEYLRYDFGNATYSTPYSSKQIYTDTNLLRVGASVHF